MNRLLIDLIDGSDNVLSHMLGLKPAQPIGDNEMVDKEVFVSLLNDAKNTASAIRNGNMKEALTTVSKVATDIETIVKSGDLENVVTVSKNIISDLETSVNDITTIVNDVKHGNVNWIDVVGKFEEAVSDVNKIVADFKAL